MSSTVIEFSETANKIRSLELEYDPSILAPLLAKNSFGIFPSGIRYVEFLPDNSVTILYQEPPRKRLVRYKYYAADSYEWYEIEVPYVTYLMRATMTTITASHMFFTPYPLRSMSDNLCWATLPNLYNREPGDSAGKICTAATSLSNLVFDAETSQINLYASIHTAIESYWSSNFNDDLPVFRQIPPFVTMIPHGTTNDHKTAKGFQAWEQLTSEQVLQLPYEPAMTAALLVEASASIKNEINNYDNYVGAWFRRDLANLFQSGWNASQVNQRQSDTISDG